MNDQHHDFGKDSTLSDTEWNCAQDYQGEIKNAENSEHTKYVAVKGDIIELSRKDLSNSSYLTDLFTKGYTKVYSLETQKFYNIIKPEERWTLEIIYGKIPEGNDMFKVTYSDGSHTQTINVLPCWFLGSGKFFACDVWLKDGRAYLAHNGAVFVAKKKVVMSFLVDSSNDDLDDILF